MSGLKDHISTIYKKNGLFLVALLILPVVAGYAILEHSGKSQLKNQYMVLHNQSNELSSYYEELLTRYNESLEEYDELSRNYTKVLREYQELKQEHFDVINHKKWIILEEDREIVIESGENFSLSYNIPASGYVEVEYNSTSDIYLWFGSTIEEGYYARYPAFPATSSLAKLKIPVTPDLVIYIGNPNSVNVKISLDITLVY
jgi:uncharacterized membrane-anchored protein YhcB (DUF1043 family)